MISIIENPKDATKNLLELINEFSIVTGYIINIQKFVMFYTPITNDQKKKSRRQLHLQLYQKV